MKKISVVILNYNGRKHLEEFLPSVVEHTQGSDTEIIIADNHSTDDSVNFLVTNYPNIQQIRMDVNSGYAGGYNEALKQVESEYFVLLNSDVEATKNWLGPIIKYLDENSDVAAAMPKIKAYKNKEYFEYAGASGGFIDRYGYPFCRGRILYNIEKDEGQYDTIRDIFWASGACFVIRAELFRKAGGFDSDFFAHMEEIDLCWRLKSMGFRIVVIPESVVFHLGGGTLPINTPKKMFFNYRNSLFLLQKNLSRKRFFPIIFSRLCLDGASAMVYLAKFSFGFFGAVIRAHMQFYSSFFYTNRKRKAVKKLARTNMVGEIYPKSMVFGFMIKKSRIFAQLKY
jgi:GT2 family glycosyltransferase